MLKRWAAWPQGVRWRAAGIAAVVVALAMEPDARQCRRVTMLIQRRPGEIAGIVCQRAPSRMSHRAPNRPYGFSASRRACSTAIRALASSPRVLSPAASPRMPNVRQEEVLQYLHSRPAATSPKASSARR